MEISPSILSADFLRLGEQIEKINDTDCEMIHLDVMDGIFVPNISFGFPIVQAVRYKTSKLLDCHLMIQNPLDYVQKFADAGCDVITFHCESQSDIGATIKKIKLCGKKVGISIKPSTGIEKIEHIAVIRELDMILVMSVEPGFGGQKFIDSTLQKIALLKKIRSENGLRFKISVDGGINRETAILCKESGADILVAGKYFFDSDDFQSAIDSLR